MRASATRGPLIRCRRCATLIIYAWRVKEKPKKKKQEQGTKNEEVKALGVGLLGQNQSHKGNTVAVARQQ